MRVIWGVRHISCGLAALVLWWAAAGPAAAQSDPVTPADLCALPDSLIMDDSSLPRTAARLAKGEPFRIIVMGSASSAGMGTSGPGKSYPPRLEVELRHRLDRSDVLVTILAHQGATAADMVAALDREVISRHPVLVVWQTGTVEARRAMPLRDLGAALSDGIHRLHAAGIDVVLMDVQFSPRLSGLVDYGAYSDFLQQISDRFDTILIRRYDMMQHWNETGAIRLEPENRAEQQAAADQVHACLAKHVARMIADGLRHAAPPVGK